MVGLGLALAQPKRPVAVITGDGEQLMGIGSLLTIGAKKVGNLTIVVLDNGQFGEPVAERELGKSLGRDRAGPDARGRRGRAGGCFSECHAQDRADVHADARAARVPRDRACADNGGVSGP